MTNKGIVAAICWVIMPVIFGQFPITTWAVEERELLNNKQNEESIPDHSSDAAIACVEKMQSLRTEMLRTEIFGRQLIYDPIILIVVIVIVFSGIYLSYLQVKRDLGTNSAQDSSIEITRDGVKVRSAVIGLLILFISLAFFYLYLTQVYTIRELGCDV